MFELLLLRGVLPHLSGEGLQPRRGLLRGRAVRGNGNLWGMSASRGLLQPERPNLLLFRVQRFLSLADGGALRDPLRLRIGTAVHRGGMHLPHGMLFG